jgi:hypothetical protein
MTGPFKMKGSPMQRNFGIGSPAKRTKDTYTREEFDSNMEKHKTSAYENLGEKMLLEGSDEWKQYNQDVEDRRSDYFQNYDSEGNRKEKDSAFKGVKIRPKQTNEDYQRRKRIAASIMGKGKAISREKGGWEAKKK